MPQSIDVHEPNELIWTMGGGALYAYRVGPDGSMVQVDVHRALDAERLDDTQKAAAVAAIPLA